VVSVFAGNDVGEQEADNLFGGILIDASSWQPPLALPTGLVEWGVFYASDPTPIVNLVGDLSVTVGSIDWLPHPLIDATGLSGTWPETKPFMVVGSETIAEITVPEASEVLQGGVALAMLGLLAHLRVRKRGFADAA
jgi:hypothetical protein